jgi:hypothetical protein
LLGSKLNARGSITPRRTAPDSLRLSSDQKTQAQGDEQMKGLVGTAALLIVAVVGYFGYTTFKPAAQASAPITSAPVAAATGSASAATGAVFRIDQNASTARFIIDEVLRGTPTTVVGTTNQVAGEIAANLNDIDAASVGPIRINARTLTTDAESRRALLAYRTPQRSDSRSPSRWLAI